MSIGRYYHAACYKAALEDRFEKLERKMKHETITLEEAQEWQDLRDVTIPWTKRKIESDRGGSVSSVLAHGMSRDPVFVSRRHAALVERRALRAGRMEERKRIQATQ